MVRAVAWACLDAQHTRSSKGPGAGHESSPLLVVEPARHDVVRLATVAWPDHLLDEG
jgi:hypothetical protein